MSRRQPETTNVHLRLPVALLEKVDQIAAEQSKATGLDIDRPTALRGVITRGVETFAGAASPKGKAA